MKAARDTAATEVEIIRPDGRIERPERRQGAPAFRPYAADAAMPPGAPANPVERRARRRARGADQLGRRIDIVS